MPFVVVILINLVREALEDYRKYQYDKEANNSLANIFYKDKFLLVKWKKLQVGNIIKINQNDILPVDILIIKSSANNGFCYLETANLDGESSLKPREALLYPHNMIKKEEHIEQLIKTRIEMDQPNMDIYKIDGTVFMNAKENERTYFNIKNTLLRGGRLKNTEYVYGIIIYTGKDTKLMQNIKKTSSKLSSIDKKTNIIVIYIFCIVMLICAICTILGAQFRKDNFPDYNKGLIKADYMLYYNQKIGPDNSLGIARIFTANFLIYTTLIPMSIIIIMAIVKLFQALSIEYFEIDFRKNEEDKIKCFSPSLQEEMGMVKYIFSDKTGTLTRNEMKFKACSIYNCLFTDDEEIKEFSKQTNYSQKNSSSDRTSQESKTSQLKDSLRKVLSNINQINRNEDNNAKYKTIQEPIKQFFCNLAINHDVLTEKINNSINFQGSNPDEVALVSFAAEIGFTFIERTNNCTNLHITINGKEETKIYEILDKFDFTSLRQRSSIIVRDTITNEINMYLKGSDKKIFQSINLFSKQKLLAMTKEHVDYFAKKGLRTLCYSYKTIDIETYEKWKVEYEDMKYKCLLNQNLSSELETLIDKIEGNSDLLGATALEDKLQDEVKEDLVSFLEAGINFWMITGDKMDTAESIGYSCKLFKDDTEVYKIKDTTINQEVIERLKDIKKEIQSIQDNSNQDLVLGKKIQKNNLIEENFVISHCRNSIPNKISHSGNDFNENKKKPVQTYNYQFIGNENNILQDNSLIPEHKYSFDLELNHSFNHLFPTGEEEKSVDKLHNISILRYMADKQCFDDENVSYDKLSIIQKKVDCEPKKIMKTETINKQPIAKTATQMFGVPLEENQFNQYFDFCNEQVEKINNNHKPKKIDKVFNPTFHQRNMKLQNNVKKGLDYSIIIEGQSISHCIDKDEARELFWELIKKSHSLICCRCSPIQKGQIVEFVKKQSQAITLAIGDGGNDVNMIKAANVGIGLFGKEGYQAAYNSDYAISQFKYLKRLIFYNGYFGLERISYFIYFYFFKNVLFTIPQFLLAFYSGFSGTILYDSWYLMGFNSFVTVAPIAIRTVVEESYDPDFKGYPAQSTFLKYLIPDIYKEYRDSVPFNVLKFVLVFLVGVLFSLPIYFIPAFCFQYGIRDNTGMNFGFWDISLSTYLAVVTIHFFVICLDTMLYNWVIDGMYSLQLLVDVLFFIIYQSCDYDIGLSGDLYMILSSLMFWLIFLFACMVVIIPFYIYRRIEYFFGNLLVNKIKQSKCEDYFIEKYYKKKLGKMVQATRSVAKFKKIYSMKKDKEYDTLADQQIKKIVDEYKQKVDK